MPRSRTTSSSTYRKGIFFSKNPAKAPTIRYWCTICSDSAGRLAEFRRHMDCHSDNYQFMCDRSGCRQVGRGVGFRQRSNLQTHLDNAHNPENKYACTHSWENKDGTIEACAARFKSNGGLSTHLRRAHGFDARDDVSKISIPTPEGADFEYRNGRRGRRGDSAGAVIFFPDWCGDDYSAEAQFVDDVLSNTEQLKQSLAQHDVPYSALPFHWPEGSSRGKQPAAKSSPGSMPASPVQYHSIAVPFADSTARNPLPYPLTTNPSALATGSSSTMTHVGQQSHAYDPEPPASAPFFTQPLATSTTFPPPPPAPTQGMGAEGSWTVAPQATDLRLPLPDDAVLVPMPSGPPTLALADHVGWNYALTTTHAPLSRDVVNVVSGSLPGSYAALADTLPDGVNDMSLESMGAPSAEPDYQYLQEPSKWFPCGDGYAT